MTDSRSRHLVDPQLEPLLEMLAGFKVSAETLQELRTRPAMAVVDPADVARTSMTVRAVPGPAGAPEVNLVIYRPVASDGVLPCIFHIHGGGYIIGSAAGGEANHRPMAADLNCCIISVEYRLAPETPHPGPVEDCYAALGWVVAHAGELKIDTARLGLMGESAGGGLAAALALLVRDRGEYRLAFQHLIYPMLDDRTCTHDDPHPYAGEFVWTPEANLYGWTSLLGRAPGGDGVSPYAAPARAESVAGLPPTFISTGSLDLVLEEDLEYARRLLRAGVPTELHVYPGGFHAFDAFPGSDLAVVARRDSRAALVRALAG